MMEKSCNERSRISLCLLLGVLFVFISAISDQVAWSVGRRQAKELCQEGEQLFRQGDLRGAFDKFKQSTETDYLYSRPHYFIGLIFERQGKIDEATAAFQQARELEPQNDIYIKKLAEIDLDKARKLVTAGNYKEAITMLEEIENDVPYELSVHTLQAEVHCETGNYPAVLQDLEPIFTMRKNMKIKREDPQVALAFIYSALAKFKLRRFYEAYTDISEARKTGSAPSDKLTSVEKLVLGKENLVVTALNEAERLFQAGHFKKAAEKYEEIRQLDKKAAHFVGSKIKESRLRVKAQSLFTDYKQLVSDKKWKEALKVLDSIDKLGISDDYLEGAINKFKLQMKKKIEKKESDISDEDFEGDLARFKTYDLFRAELDLDILYEEAEEHRKAGRYREAETLYGRIISEDRDFREAASRYEKMRSIISHQEKRPYIIGAFVIFGAGLIWWVLKKLLDRLPEVMTKRAFESFVFHKTKGNWQKVISFGQKLTGKSLMKADQIKVLLGMSQAYQALEQYSDALRMASEAARLDQRSGQAHTMLAKTYLAMGRDDEIAFSEYQRLYDLEPQNQALLEALCACYLKRSSTDKKAVDTYKRVLQREPDRGDLLVQIAQSYIEDDRLDGEALALYEKLCGLYPEEISYHRVLARACLSREMYDEAIDEARFLIEENVSDPVGHEVLAEAYLRRSLVEEAVNVYKELVQEYPGERFLQRKLDRLRERLVIATGAVPEATTTAIKVCQRCAHLNSNVDETCRNCGATL